MVIPPQNLKSQGFLEDIQKWTKNQLMTINEEKTKCMVFNFTKNNQFSTRFTLNGKTLETVKEIKLLGTILTDNLKWDKIQNF